jgi:putative ABC transport system substrate-binding protein
VASAEGSDRTPHMRARGDDPRSHPFMRSPYVATGVGAADVGAATWRSLRMLTILRLCIVAALLLTASSQPASAQKATKVWHVALCHVGLDHEPPGLYSLHKTLNEMGYVDGRNLKFDWRNQADAASAAATIKQWVAARVDAIVAFEDQCVRAAKSATSRIPIVFVQVYDPQRAGYVKSLAHPGGNLTGTVANLRLIDKRLQLLKEIDPKVGRILVLFDGRDPYAAGEVTLAREAAAPLRLQLVERDASSEADLRRIFAALRPGEVDAVIAASPDLQTNHPRLIIQLGNNARLPVVGHREAWVEWGALLSYSTDADTAGPVAARYIDKIFKGANPADLSVEELSTTVFAVNMKRVQELGLTIPPAIAARIDKKVE